MVKIVDIKNQNLKGNEADMFLKQEMEEVSMDSQELAHKLKVSPVTVHRWLNTSRKVSPEQAIEIAKNYSM